MDRLICVRGGRGSRDLSLLRIDARPPKIYIILAVHITLTNYNLY